MARMGEILNWNVVDAIKAVAKKAAPAGSASLKPQKLEEIGTLTFTDGLGGQAEVLKNETFEKSTRPINGEKVAVQHGEIVSVSSIEPNKTTRDKKITMADPLVVTEKRQLDLSALHLRKREADVPVEKRDIYAAQLTKLQKKRKATTGEDVVKARSLRKDILRSIEQKKIDAVAEARKADEERLAEKGKTERIEALKNENPDFYRVFEEEMAKLEWAFIREFEATREAYKTWERSSKRSDGKLLRSQEEGPEKEAAKTRMATVRAMDQKIADLVETFNDLDDRFPEDGLKGLLLLSELRALVEKMPKSAQERKQKVLTEQEEIYGSAYPRPERIEGGHMRVLIKEEEKVLKKNCALVRSRQLYLTEYFGNIGQLEDHISALVGSFNNETPLEEIEKVLEDLQVLENEAFSETPPEKGKPFDKRAKLIRKLKEGDGDKTDGVQEKNKRGRNRGNKRDLILGESSEGVSQEPIPDRQAIDKMWREILAAAETAKKEAQNNPIPSEREINLGEVNRLLAEAQEAALVSNGKGMVSRMEILQNVAEKISALLPQTDMMDTADEQSEVKKFPEDEKVAFEAVVAELKEGVSALIPQALAKVNQMWLESENTSLAILVKSDPGRVTKRLEFIRGEIIKEVEKKSNEHQFSSDVAEKTKDEIDSYAERLLISELTKIVATAKVQK